MKILHNPKLILLASLILIGACVLAISFIPYSLNHKPSVAFGDYNVTGGGTYRLQASLSSTQTTVTLSSFKEPVSNIPYTMSYLNSSIEYATLEPQSNNREFVSFSGVTQNSDGSATLTGVTRGLSPSYPFTASSTFQLSHSAQSIFILSNPPQLYNQYGVLINANSWTGINTFASTSPPQYDGAVTASGNQLVSAAQLNSTAFQGAATATEATLGLTRLATSAQVGAGTASSTTGAPLVIPNKFATTTPGALCTSSWSCVVSAVAGKISQSWLNLTAAFSFSGGLTSTATTTLAGSNVNSNAIVINTVATQWPSAHGGVGSILSDNGSGVLSWASGITKYAATTTGSISTNIGAYSTTSLIYIPAGVLGASSQINFWGKLQIPNGSSASCTVVISEPTHALTFGTALGGGNIGNVQATFSGSIAATSSLSGQRDIMIMNGGNGGSCNACIPGGGAAVDQQDTFFNWSAGLNLQISIQNTGNVNGCNLQNYFATVVP